MTAESFTPRLVAALDRTWSSIRARHPDVPEVVITLGAGTGGSGPAKLGHFAAARWQRGPAEELPEMFVAGEGLSRGAADVLATLLHEGAHGAAAARKVQDTSRQGRWHNARYRAIAAELSLDVAQAPAIGWSDTTVPPATAACYAAELGDLAAALTAWRHPEHRRRRPRIEQQRRRRPLPLRPPDPRCRVRPRGRADHLRPVPRRVHGVDPSSVTHPDLADPHREQSRNTAAQTPGPC
jgi:hypothetical protein